MTLDARIPSEAAVPLHAGADAADTPRALVAADLHWR